MEKLERENSQLRDQIGNLMFDVSVKQNIIDNMNELNSSSCKLSIGKGFMPLKLLAFKLFKNPFLKILILLKN